MQARCPIATNPAQRSLLHRLALAAGALVVAACGGGGGDDDGGGVTERAASSPEGFYVGTSTGGVATGFRLFVLENNEAWLVYGTDSTPPGGTFTIDGFLQGSGTYAGGTFTATSMKDYGAAPPAAVTLSASFRTRSSGISIVNHVNATATTAGLSATFTGHDNVADYLYALPAAAADVTGNWSAALSTGETATLSVAGNGAVSLVTSRGCSGSGTLVPRGSGKNVFNFAFNFGGAPCTFAGVTFSGVGRSYRVTNSTQRQFTITARNGAQSAGLIVVGAR